MKLFLANNYLLEIFFLPYFGKKKKKEKNHFEFLTDF